MSIHFRDRCCAIAIMLAVSLSPAASAQVVFSETFRPTYGCFGTTPYFPAGWTRANVDALTPVGTVGYVNAAWVVREDFLSPNPQDCAAFSTSWYSPAGTANDFMCTPQINMPPEPVLSWRALAPDPSYADGYEVRVMTTVPTGGTGLIGNLLTASTTVTSIAAENSTWTSRQVELPEFANAPAWICFRNNSDNKFLLLIDDVVVRYFSFDVAAVQPEALSRYSRVPAWAGYSVAPGVRVIASGGRPVTNVSVLAESLLDASVNSSITSNTIATLPGNSATVAVFNQALPINAPGTWSMRYRASIAEPDPDPVNNVVSSGGLIATSDELARDSGPILGALGIGALVGGEMGQQFDVPVEFSLRAIRYEFFQNNGVGWPGQNVVANLRAWDVARNKPGQLIASTEPFVSQAAPAVVEAGFANGPLTLPPGRYVATVSEPVGGPSMQLAITDEVFTPGTVWVNWPTIPGGDWRNLETFDSTFTYALKVSLRLDPPPVPMFGDGFEDPLASMRVTLPVPRPTETAASAPIRRSVPVRQLVPELDQ